MTCVPTSVEPVNEILRTSGWSTSASPASEPLPGTTLRTPGGRPASTASSARASAVSGVTSAGLTTTELPIARAGATFQPRIAIGKFQGVIAAQTPIGSRKVSSVPLRLAGDRSAPWNLSTAPA